ncbi:RHS repeat-associated core domain-containing protein, partial [Pseudomonas sp. F1_0610]|uniref:RHS repeat domain-containing protein n=1 Tax=Pseudomonas sp. F1_0610 TaxID=3114284 RepID=UPI0039C18DC1
AANSEGTTTWQAQMQAFGETTPDSTNLITMNLRYPGQYFDAETGTHYNYFRDYNPRVGRYSQSDPIGLSGGINHYGYAGGNGLRFVDTKGLKVLLCKRPMDLSFIPDWAAESIFPSHAWIKTDEKEAGMGGDCDVPAQGCADVPYSRVHIKDHTGEHKAHNASCQIVDNVDEGCVNELLQIDEPLGRWTIINQCQSFADSVIRRCRPVSFCEKSELVFFIRVYTVPSTFREYEHCAYPVQ